MGIRYFPVSRDACHTEQSRIAPDSLGIRAIIEATLLRPALPLIANALAVFPQMDTIRASLTL